MSTRRKGRGKQKQLCIQEAVYGPFSSQDKLTPGLAMTPCAIGVGRKKQNNAEPWLSTYKPDKVVQAARLSGPGRSQSDHSQRA